MRDIGGAWWRHAVVYEIYPRSFADADGDGVGDLQGVLGRLDHVAGLGVNAVWLTPFQRSPQADHGYDVSDYRDVDPLFGTLADFDALVSRAHALGLRVVVDLVPNHCSTAHPIFRAAVAAGPGSPQRARFHFAAGRGPVGRLPPNNWPSVFGGPAWTRIVEPDGRPGEWYLHLYAPEQPDWNWRHPATEPLFADVLRFWLDRGVDGVRIDVAHGLFKADGLPDTAGGVVEPMRLRGNRLACDQEPVHEVYRRWRRIADGYVPPRVLIGEVNLEPERAARYVRGDELHQAFAFAFLTAPWDPASWRAAAEQLLAQAAVTGAPVTWVVENHDVVRTPTRYGGGARGAARARAALLTVLALPGAAYLYQGQELGLPEADVPPVARQDPAWRRAGVSRDGARVPLPWTRARSGSHGFSPAADSAPAWLPTPPAWAALSVEAQHDDPGSSLTLCRAAVGLRRQLHTDGILSSDDPVRVTVSPDGLLLAERGPAFT
ncbi:MAG: alpha-amylase family glycosyl hydrolase, partial [Actinomycetota bacterium]|nr:alpha-amylase family glycosyl hydrolase [Actinomycetota bacterium]